MWFWRRFFSFSVLTVSFGLGLGLEPLWTRTWLGLEPLWTWTWLWLEPLWTWTCLGLDKGGLDYSPRAETSGLILLCCVHATVPRAVESASSTGHKNSFKPIASKKYMGTSLESQPFYILYMTHSAKLPLLNTWMYSHTFALYSQA